MHWGWLPRYFADRAAETPQEKGVEALVVVGDNAHEFEYASRNREYWPAAHSAYLRLRRRYVASGRDQAITRNYSNYALRRRGRDFKKPTEQAEINLSRDRSDRSSLA